MSQNWFRPHPYGVYPLGNAGGPEQTCARRFGTLSFLQCAAKGRIDASGAVIAQPAEDAFVELFLGLLSFCPVDDICRLSATCTGWYCFIHASDAFKQAHGLISPEYLRFCGSWKETAIRAFFEAFHTAASGNSVKRSRVERSFSPADVVNFKHHPVAVNRAFFNDQLFQAWMCTILPCHYHLCPIGGGTRVSGAAWGGEEHGRRQPQCFSSALKEVPRCDGLSPKEFRERFEKPNLPVVLTDVATEWPIFKILDGKFSNLAAKKGDLFRLGVSYDLPMRCEHTTMSIDDYVRYATEQNDERCIYMFDAEFGNFMAVESLYTVPEHFGRDDFFKVLGDARPKYRWIIAGPRRGGSSFHVDPNYTSAWNANLVGRKRWILFPPGSVPAGVFPSSDMSEVTTPVSLTEWLLNHYDATVTRFKGVGYECVCEPGDIIFVPCGWWHFVINLEDSVAITQNYVSECNLLNVLKFLFAMKSSISGIDEDSDNAAKEVLESRRACFAEEFSTAMRASFPDLMRRVDKVFEEEADQRRKKRKECVALPLLAADDEGFKFDF